MHGLSEATLHTTPEAETMGELRIDRTYPQPDSPNPKLGPRERAMAVFKYLLNLEPHEALKHPLFACIEHSYKQAVASVGNPAALEPSLVEMLTSSTTSPARLRMLGGPNEKLDLEERLGGGL